MSSKRYSIQQDMAFELAQRDRAALDRAKALASTSDTISLVNALCAVLAAGKIAGVDLHEALSIHYTKVIRGTDSGLDTDPTPEAPEQE